MVLQLFFDELIYKLEHSGYGCKIGNNYFRILIYADGIFLLSPSAYGLQKMLTLYSSFANQNGLHFNVKKTQCIMFHHKQCVDTNIELTLEYLHILQDIQISSQILEMHCSKHILTKMGNSYIWC